MTPKRGEYRARWREGCARLRTQIDRGPRKADALWGEDCQTRFVPEPQRDRGTALAVDEVFPWFSHGHPERSPAEIPPSLRLVLLRSSTPLRFAQYDTAGRSRSPSAVRIHYPKQNDESKRGIKKH